MVKRYGLISDTHGVVHRDIHGIFDGVEAILHSGDVGGEDVFAELETIAPVHAVAGNVDPVGGTLPQELVIDLPFGTVAIAHGHHFPTDREKRAKALMDHFSAKTPRIHLFGHSHLPHMEWRSNTWLINPGSAGRRRFNQPVTVALLEWEKDHDLLRLAYHELEWRS